MLAPVSDRLLCLPIPRTMKLLEWPRHQEWGIHGHGLSADFCIKYSCWLDCILQKGHSNLDLARKSHRTCCSSVFPHYMKIHSIYQMLLCPDTVLVTELTQRKRNPQIQTLCNADERPISSIIYRYFGIPPPTLKQKAWKK